MGTQSLLEMYAAELMKVQERDLARSRPKTSSGNHGWKPKEWTPEEIAELEAFLDRHEDAFQGCTRLNYTSSSEHIANILFRDRFRHNIPDEVWVYMVKKVDYWKVRIPDDDELWEFRNMDGWWASFWHAKKRVEYYRHRSKRQSLVKESDL